MADPNARDDQLHMVRTWNAVFAAQGQGWGIPPEHLTRLVYDESAARTILDAGAQRRGGTAALPLYPPEGSCCNSL